MPPAAIHVEPAATNTGQNIQFSRDLLERSGTAVGSVLLISKPYMEPRAFATCRKVWPEVQVRCASEPLGFESYLGSIGDARLVVDMVVGDLQRLIEYPKLGYAVEQVVPQNVADAYRRLVGAGFTSRLLTT